MNLTQCKTKVKGYILELTKKGVLIPEASNADYLALVPDKADAEQKFLANIRKPKSQCTFDITDAVAFAGNWYNYTMPANFKEHSKLTYYDLEGCIIDVPYRWYADNVIQIYSTYTGTYTEDYYKQVATIDSTTDGSTEFEIDADAQELIPLKCAMEIIPEDKLQLAGFLTDQYRFKLSNLKEPANYRNTSVVNVMGWY